ncbi:hypothetical protein PS2_000679 [Malus domestica]
MFFTEGSEQATTINCRALIQHYIPNYSSYLSCIQEYIQSGNGSNKTLSAKGWNNFDQMLTGFQEFLFSFIWTQT